MTGVQTCDPLSGTGACGLGYVDIVDCSQNPAYAKPQLGIVNASTSCQCANLVPAQESSWGQIKALYTE